jgi:hypothetical protein
MKHAKHAEHHCFKSPGDVIKKTTHKSLMRLLKAMSARKVAQKILKERANELDHVVDTYDGTKENSNFDKIMAGDAFHAPTEEEGRSSQHPGGYQPLHNESVMNDFSATCSTRTNDCP